MWHSVLSRYALGRYTKDVICKGPTSLNFYIIKFYDFYISSIETGLLTHFSEFKINKLH